MKKFIVYLMVIVLAVSLGFAVFYLVKDDEVISISSASIYTDVNKDFTIDVNHENKKSYTKINITSSDENIVKYNESNNSFSAISGGVARINFRTNNVKFRNLWCDVIVGDGTETSPFYISSVEQLSAIGMGEELENGVYAGASPYTDYTSDKCYKLVSDIDVKGINEGHWIPLRNFKGTFDGNGYTISNVNIDYDEYTELFKDTNNYNPNLHAIDKVGFFQSIDNTGKVFNIKFTNYRATGRYTTFGALAGENYGTIERVEIKDAYISVENKDIVNGAIGGLVGKNITTDNGSGTSYERFVARIDRCSVNLTLGKKRTFENEEFVENIIGVNGIVGGLVGINNGGTIVYSYTNGEVNFLSDNLEEIVYGGLIGQNSFSQLTSKGGLYPTIYQGANIKDCYSNIKTHFELSLTNANSRVAGAIARNIDFSGELYENDSNKEIVQNYIIGVYYNAENLNAEEEGITKGFKGIAEFAYGIKTVDYVEDETLPIVLGLGTEGMKDANKFISHYTSDIDFDDEGVSQGVKSIAVNWLFDTVWAINENENDGMPYLNYQLVYIPNDFNTVGTAVVISGKYQYINTEVEYPVTIISGNDKKINIEVGEEYNLKVNPAGLTLNWTSNNNTVVSVDSNGTIKGLKPGSASISVTTKTGLFSDYIDVYVSGVSYSITNTPEEIVMNVGETYTFKNIVVTPVTTLTYSVADETIASVDSTGKVTALVAGETFVTIKAGETAKVVKVKIYAPTSTIRAVDVLLSSFAIFNTYDGTPKTGTLSVKSAMCGGVDLKNVLTFKYTSTNDKIVSIDNTGKYTIKGTGNAVIKVSVVSDIYEGYSYCVFEIEAKAQEPGEEIPPVVDAGLKHKSYNMNVGDSIYIETYGDILSIDWSSSNENIVTVNNGLAKGIAKGTATIYAEIFKQDGTYAYESCDITVIDTTPTPVITLTPGNTSVYTGQTVTFTATLNVSGTLIWEFEKSTSDVATIEKNGNTVNITMLKAGSVKVIVSYGDAVRTARVTATEATTYVKEIYTVAQLENVRNFLDKEFVLMADLDLSGSDWTPIGTKAKPFTGIFTSKFKNAYTTFKISGLNVNSTNGGLFGYTKNATLNNIRVTDSTIKGSVTAGAIVGTADNTKIYACSSENNSISATSAGGIVGTIISGGVYDATVTETSVSTLQTTSSANIGGVVGYLSSSVSVNDAIVENRSKYISIGSGSHGNAGGVVGYALGSVNGARVSAKVVANDSDSDYAGGIAGYSAKTIANGIVSDSTIEGYYAGGIGGTLNTGKTISLDFKNTKDGYRKEDLQYHSAYSVDVHLVAVKDTVSIRGEEVGGLFGTINSGVVRNCYTRAYLNGYDRKSFVSGFASLIMSSGFDKDGGRGQVGIIENCYSACTFSGSCYDYAISKSQVHDDYDKRTAGYVFNFVFDNTLAKNTDYIDASGLFKKDPVQARKTTSEMKQKGTYTDKDFSSSYWNFSGGYPTLIIEN